jgi:hypothetical protein
MNTVDPGVGTGVDYPSTEGERMRVLAAGALVTSGFATVVVGLAAGPLAGVLVFTALTALGTAVLGAWRDRRHVRRLERRLVPVPIHRVVRDDAPVRSR